MDIENLITKIQDAPIPTILILAGLFFILLGFVSRLGGFIEVSTDQKKLAIPIGLMVLSIGLVIFNSTERPSQISVAPSKSPAISNDGWAVILSSAKNLNAAKNEIDMAAKQGINNASIYFRNGFYASIVVVGNESNATEYLEAKAKKNYQRSYIAPISTWCQNMQKHEDFIECLSTP